MIILSKFSVSDVVNFTDTQKSKELNPRIDFVLVQAGDIGGSYVAGSEGQIKTILEYADPSANRLLNTTTLTYTDALFPTKVTGIVVS